MSANDVANVALSWLGAGWLLLCIFLGSIACRQAPTGCVYTGCGEFLVGVLSWARWVKKMDNVLLRRPVVSYVGACLQAIGFG